MGTVHDILVSANTFHKQGRLPEAADLYDKALALEPNNVIALDLRGVVCCQRGQYAEGFKYFELAISLNPFYADVYYDYGRALQYLNRDADAVHLYSQAINCNPGYIQALLNRGIAFNNLKQYELALADFNRAIAIRPDYADAYWNKSMTRLLQGDFAEGWRLYEWRWKRSDRGPDRKFTCPLWLGEAPLEGKSILISSEQGLGDAIQFSRYLPMLKAAGARVWLETPPELYDLFAAFDSVAQRVPRGDPLPPTDYYCPIMSLPLAFRTLLHSVPATMPYLSPAPAKRNAWKQRLSMHAPQNGRVGLVWAGSPTHLNNQNRSMPVQFLEPILRMSHHFCCLQKDISKEENQFLSERGVSEYTRELKSFADTAALLACMDLVISVDTAVAHLAGAMGKPVWLLLPYAPDFRWLAEGRISPWYPSMELFRQTRIGDWATVMAEVAARLSTHQWPKAA